MTCTPYGINTHRLLVRGSRIDGLSEAKVMSDAIPIEGYMVALVIVIIFAAAALIYLLIRNRKRH